MDGQILVKVGADIGNFTRNIQSVTNQVSGLGKTFSGISNIVGGAVKASAVAIGGLGTAISTVGISYNAMQEQSTVAWTTLLGSVSEAEDMLKNISDLAKNTQFETESVDMMAKYFHNAGLKGRALTDEITKIADVSGAFAMSADSAAEMARQMSQVRQSGVAYTEDLNILQDRGVPIFKALAEQMGVNVAEVRKLASEGKITADIYNSAFDSIATSVEGSANAQSQTFSGMISTIKDNVKILSGELTEGLFGKVKGALQVVLSLLESFNTGLQEGGLKAAIANVMPTAIEAQTMVTNFINTVTQNLPNVLETGRNILTSVLNGITEALPTLVPTVINIIRSIIETIGGNISLVLTAGVDILSALVEGIANSLPNIVNTAIGIITNLVGTLISNIPKIIDTGVKMLTSLIDGISKALPNLLYAGVKLIIKLAAAIVQNLPKILDAGVKIINSLVKGILSMAVQLGKAVLNDIVPKIVDTLKEIDMIEIGKDIIRGLIKGIGSMVGAVKEKVASLADNLPGWLKKKLGIHSPSRVLNKEVGKWIPLGMAEGITRNINAVRTAAQSMAEAAIPSISDYSAPVNISGSMTGAVDAMESRIQAQFDEADANRGDLVLVMDAREVARAQKPYIDSMQSRSLKLTQYNKGVR